MPSTRPPRRTTTYAASGVDRSAIGRALSALLASARSVAPSSHGRPIELSGHYAGLIRLGGETIAATTDTVGTKVLLAAELGRWEEVGEDLVAINVNDLAAVGARTAGIVDTIVCARPEPRRFRAIGRGIARGLRAAECTLLGGETAVVPELVRDIDLGATAVGFFPHGRAPVTGRSARVGDRLLGIPSSGLHANGFTLVRRVLAEAHVDLRARARGGRSSIGVELLRATRTYSRAADALATVPGVRGLAHISGGGVRNLVRWRPDVRYVLDRWPPIPPLFEWLAATGGIAPAEMFQTFNMGIGFAAVVAPSAVPRARTALARAGAGDAIEIGRVGSGRGVTVPAFDLAYDGYA